MVNYEEAKEKALSIVLELGYSIDTASELPGAYVFDDSENTYDGYIPLVISKDDGRAFNYWRYMLENKLKPSMLKPIPF